MIGSENGGSGDGGGNCYNSGNNNHKDNDEKINILIDYKIH